MSAWKRCPTCQNEAGGGLLGGVFIRLHKCKDPGHVFCDKCKNGDRCPLCKTADVWWNFDKAFTDR
jgi:predicted Zn-ribbon and HTH transcriptional regulator